MTRHCKMRFQALKMRFNMFGSFKCLRMHSRAQLLTENCHYMGYSVIWVCLYGKSQQCITRHCKTRFQALKMRLKTLGSHLFE